MKLTTALVLGWFSVAGMATADAAPVPGQPVFTNKTRFRIPYRYDAAEMQRLGAREIRLFVSLDRGQTWHHAQSVAPEAGRFEFQAPRDGEYAFAVRTLDAGNRLHPPGNITEPELSVTVDTTPPALEIGLRQLEPGRVQLAWNATDPNLDPRQLRLEYIQSGEANWQKVSIVPQPSGQTAWTTPQGGYVAVRGTISDLAGNTGNAQGQVRVEAAGITAPRPSIPDLQQPIAEEQPAAEMASTFAPPNLSGMSGPAMAAPGFSAPLPMIASAPMPSIPQQSEFAAPPAIAPANRLISDEPESRPEVLSGRYSSPSAPMQTGLSARTRMVNSRRFEIGYKVEDVGPSGINTVDLYITEDDGGKWYKYGMDDDLQSPVLVEVPRDGIYGFDLRVRSGAGLGAPPPQPDEKPSIVVIVDQTPPAAQLSAIEQGRGAAINRLTIRWTSRDDYPLERPVTLSYASSLAGPWEPITGSIANTGSYEWTIGPGLPARLYVRLMVRDAAGNVTTLESSDPVLVDLLRPTARIVDVESANPRQ